MKQITIYELLPYLKSCWVCYDGFFGWQLYEHKPKLNEHLEWEADMDSSTNITAFFNIKPFFGHPKESLIRVE